MTRLKNAMSIFASQIFDFSKMKNSTQSIFLIFFTLLFFANGQLYAQTEKHGKEKGTVDSAEVKKDRTFWRQVKENVKLGGWIDAQYQFAQSEDRKSSVFMIRRARLDLKGSLSRWVDFRLQADFAPSPRLIDAFVKVNICEYVNLQVGQFKIPFSLENILSPLDLELTENAQVISALSGYKDVSGVSSYSNGREIGLMLLGTLASATVHGEKIPILKYGVGVFGGNGINVKVDNMAKDVSARLEFCPFVNHLTVSVSGYWGKYDMLYDNVSTHNDGVRIRYAAGAQYADEHWMVRSEYLWGKTDFESFDEDQDVFIPYGMKSQGCYFTIGYWFMMGWGKNSDVQQKIRPLLRVDYYERDIDAHDPSMVYAAGVEWWPERHLRFQLAYSLRQQNFSNQFEHQLTTMLTVRF